MYGTIIKGKMQRSINNFDNLIEEILFTSMYPIKQTKKINNRLFTTLSSLVNIIIS